MNSDNDSGNSLQPIKTIGILGGGQLAMMMAQAAKKIGVNTLVLDASADACAGSVSELITAEFHDPTALQVLSERCDVITIDFENVPTATLQAFSDDLPCYPQAEFLTVVQDRWLEKTMLRESGIPTPDFFMVDSRPDLLSAVEQTGYPAVLKTRRFGYDGKGQMILRQPEDLEHAWRRFEGHALILEAFVNYDRECSIIAVRNRAGEIDYYPIADNAHTDGILHQSRAPSALADDHLISTAQRYIKQLLDDNQYVGVLTLELFVVGEQLLANEIAPRVHNSGHWSIEGTKCSQFENHIRALADMPLGDTSAITETLMINCIGQMPDVSMFNQAGLTVHDYGKAPRAGRKVGHITLTNTDADALLAMAAEIEQKMR